MLRLKNLVLPQGKKISLTINQGERIFIQGPNGSGKSLLLKAMANLSTSESTEFTFQDKPVRDFDFKKYRSEVVYVSPLPYMPLEGTVEDFMNSPLKLEIYHGHKYRLNISEYLKKWNLSGMLLNHLSSGQRQMLSLLRVVNLKARILLLDEVMSHLDPEKTLEMEFLLMEWQKSTDGTMIIVSHEEEQSRRMNGLAKKLNELWV